MHGIEPVEPPAADRQDTRAIHFGDDATVATTPTAGSSARFSITPPRREPSSTHLPSSAHSRSNPLRLFRRELVRSGSCGSRREMHRRSIEEQHRLDHRERVRQQARLLFAAGEVADAATAAALVECLSAAAGTSGDASWTSAAFMARARRCDEAGGARGVDLNTTNRTKRTKVGNGRSLARAPRARGRL